MAQGDLRKVFKAEELDTKNNYAFKIFLPEEIMEDVNQEVTLKESQRIIIKKSCASTRTSP